MKEIYIEEFDHVDQICESCPYPNGCVRECVIENYTYENVAKIRGKEQQ